MIQLEQLLVAVGVVTLFAVVHEAVALTLSARGYDWRSALASCSLALLRQATELWPLSPGIKRRKSL